MRCPKCPGMMRTYERNGVHLEQCDACRGIFLDFGELESLTRIEARLTQPAPPPPAAYPATPPPAYPAYGHGHGPQWGHHGKHHYHRGGLSHLFFSS
jgi:Zn-finger nucleic acid-binding protein